MGNDLNNSYIGGQPLSFDENLQSSASEAKPQANTQTKSAVSRALRDLSNTNMPTAIKAAVKKGNASQIANVAQKTGIIAPHAEGSTFKALYSKSPFPGLNEIRAAKGLSEPELKALTYFANELSVKELPDGISPKTIIKVLKEYYASEALMTSRSYGYMETKSGGFVVSLSESHKFEILHKKEALGTGTFGHVSRMQDIFSGAVHALKQPRADLKGIEASKARADIQNETNIINFLHKDGTRPGIQAPGFSITGIAKAHADKTGMLGRAYEASGNTVVGSMDADGQINRTEMPNHITAHGAYQLLQGLEHLHSMGVVHGDIRPGNCLVDYKNWENESTTWVLGDLGGASFADKIDMEEAKKDPVGVLTTSYLPRNDQALAERYAGYGTNKGGENKEKFIESKMQRDVFALGQSLCEMLAFAKPYPLDDADRPDTTHGFDQSFIEWYFTEDENPQELTNILKGMCDPNPEARISAKEAREQFGAWYASTYPDLASDFGIA